MNKKYIEIDIDDYLSEEDKHDIAKNLFKQTLENGFIKIDKEKRIDNYERVITNSVHNYLENEVDKIIGSDFKQILHKSVKKVLSKDLTFTVFRNQSIWNDKKSIAQEMLDEIVIENREIAERKVKKALDNLNTDNIEDYFVDVLKEVILNKLKQ